VQITDAAQVDVWWARLAEVRPAHDALLDPVERRRRDGYRRTADRDRFTLGVAVSRTVLGATLGIAPAAVPLDRSCPRCGEPHGRPRLAGVTGPAISVSHSGDVVAVAVSAATGVGVDVEVAGAPVAELADRVLSPAERDAVAALDPPARAAALLTAWVRKEAALKATGDGLGVPMTDLTVAPLDGPAGGVDWPGRPRIGLRDLRWPGPAYAACLAVVGAPSTVTECDAGPLLAAAAHPLL
jgi:4'-phosphopantetheinyl transferase